MITHIRIGLLALLLSPIAALAADTYPLADAVECRPRGGLPNVIAKLQAGEEVRVAYIGGSITAQEGWRPKTTAWLKEQYPKAKIVEINAAIGGTGSDLGVFRFRNDVLQHKPDLIFFEFAVNDGGYEPQQIYRCMEGMVRQAWKENPAIDLCYVYTMVAGMAPTIQQGKFQRSASAMEKVAEHYAIPTIHMGIEVSRLAKEDKLVLAANPKTEDEKAALKDKIVFSADGVHPHPATGHKLYLEAIQRSWEKIAPAAKAGEHKLGEPFAADNYEKARLVPLDKAKLSEGWEKLDPAKGGVAKSFQKFEPQLFAARKPGETLSFKFKGTYAGIYDLVGPDCGQLQVKVDDGPAQPVLRFDSYCTYHRMASFAAKRDLPDAVHTVLITTDGAAIDKAAILAKRNEKMNDPKRFEGTTWYASWLMIIGEMVE